MEVFVRYPVNLSLLDVAAHNPSYHELMASMPPGSERIVDYCVPVNSYFPTQTMFADMHEAMLDAVKYYPESAERLGRRLAARLGIDSGELVLANGSTELITWIDHLFIKESALTSTPTFGRWTDQPIETGKKLFTYERRKDRDYRIDPTEILESVRQSGARVLVISNPNNPTGAISERDELLNLVGSLSDLDLVIIDESFIEFSRECDIPSLERDAARFDNLIVLKSLGKNCGLHGVRLGYATGHPNLIQKLRDALPKWNINGMASFVLKLFVENQEAYELARRKCVRDRDYLVAELGKVESLSVTPSSGNFAYVELSHEMPGELFRNRLLTEHGCFIRECGNKRGSSSRHFRIAARPPADTDRLISAIQEVSASRPHKL
jgi:histidinol-phosphate/aromatic aminotransferase/cobyric acid decarboxylase-like protein